MLKVLLIDDEPTSIETLIEELKSEVGARTRKIEKFTETESGLTDFAPDVVILDIFQGGATAEGDTVGLDKYKFIWDKCFCPIIIYSAQPDDVEGEIEKHPFVRMVQKGIDSEAKVISCVKEFLPHIEALNVVQDEIRQHVNHQLRYIAPVIFDSTEGVEKKKSVLVRMSRRRIAAMMDEPFGEPIACWEQYLCPPVGECLLTGDIIRENAGDPVDPSVYRIVLTPSCDLVSSEKRPAKVKQALVARCGPIDEILADMNLSASTNKKSLKNGINSFLTRGHGTLCVPLPGLPSIVPQMAANLKCLELIELDKIGNNSESEYMRVVSIDSPFREMITWAYVQVAGRPGLPERDIEGWVDDVLAAVAAESTKGGK